MELLDVFGNDLTVVNAARVSFAKESAEFTEQDGKLIKYLAKHNHVSPILSPPTPIPIQDADLCSKGMVPSPNWLCA